MTRRAQTEPALLAVVIAGLLATGGGAVADRRGDEGRRALAGATVDTAPRAVTFTRCA